MGYNSIIDHQSNTCGRVGIQTNVHLSDLYNLHPCWEEPRRCDRTCAHNSRGSGVAGMYDQAGGAREMARKACLFARFEPLLE